MLARGPIPAGSELTISYVDMKLPRAIRRQALRDGYGFWCECVRCEKEKREEEKAQHAKEEQAAKKEEKKEANGKANTQVAAKMDELAVDDML
jgi:hypothetical protein